MPRDDGRRSDTALLHARDASGRCFAAFYRRHVSAVVALLAARGASASEAADATADTFIAALQQRRKFDPDRASARTWLLSIAANKLADARRTEARQERLQKRLRVELPALTEVDRDVYREIQAAAGTGPAISAHAGLPDRQRETVYQRVVAERDYAEIAQSLDMSEDAVRQSVSRGLAALRQALKTKEDS